jgi:23S rRNA (uracil1939-C5)-methyltransferase
MRRVEITSMTYGPYGLGRIDGKTVMVANAAPGDVVDVESVSQRRDYTIARIERVVQAAANRREPPCPFLPRCGGCDWQHIEYGAQVRLKAELLVAEFRRALGFDLDLDRLVEPAPVEFGYRARVRLKTGPGGRVGFHELGTNSIVAIDKCIVAAPELRIPVELALALGRRSSEIEIVASDGREVLVAHLGQAPRPDDIASAQRIVDSDDRVAGIVLRGAAGRRVVGNARVALEVEPGCVIEADADLFSQVNRSQNMKLVAAVLEMAAIRAGTRVLDLFCGTGNLSLPAARRGGEVTGVDSDALAVAAARRNAQRMGLRAAQFIAMHAAQTAHFLARARYHAEVVILDPPRTGAPGLMEPILRLKPHSVIYVSCDLSTLVRDLRALLAGGYHIALVRAFDFFPNTHHLEVVVHAIDLGARPPLI